MDDKPKNYWHTDGSQTTQLNPTQPGVSTPQNSPSNIGPSEDDVNWQASEYIHHDKGFLWYCALGLVTIVGVGSAVFFQQWIFAALVLVMGVAVGIYARRPPREISYSISHDGVYVDNQPYPYDSFRSFGIIDDGAFFALQLRPTKRFMPAVMMYFAEDDGERIIDALSDHLPMEDIKVDLIDKFMRWLRF